MLVLVAGGLGSCSCSWRASSGRAPTRPERVRVCSYSSATRMCLLAVVLLLVRYSYLSAPLLVCYSYPSCAPTRLLLAPAACPCPLVPVLAKCPYSYSVLPARLPTAKRQPQFITRASTNKKINLQTTRTSLNPAARPSPRRRDACSPPAAPAASTGNRSAPPRTNINAGDHLSNSRLTELYILRKLLSRRYALSRRPRLAAAVANACRHTVSFRPSSASRRRRAGERSELRGVLSTPPLLSPWPWPWPSPERREGAGVVSASARTSWRSAGGGGGRTLSARA